ncbi:MAG: CDC27 family protein [Bdellovibrionota bacterium]
MNRHHVIVVIIAIFVAAGIYWLVSEPDYTITYIPQDRHASEIDVLRRKAESESASAMDWTELASAYLAEAKFSGDPNLLELAKEAADRVLQFDSPYRKNALLVQTDVLQRRGDHEKALALLDEIERETKEEPEALALRAAALTSLGRFDEALKTAIALVQKRPSSAAHRTRALARENVGALDEAERDFIAAIGLEEKTDLSDAIENRFVLARFYFRKKELGRARRVLSPALKVSAEPRLNILLGEIELADGHEEKARSAFNLAYERDHDPKTLEHALSIKKAGAH